MEGIENLREVVIWKTELIQEVYELVDKSNKRRAAGRKPITGWAALQFIDNLFQGMKIASNYENIAKEWVDLDDQEKELLKQLVKQKLDIEDAFAEEFAERLFYMLMEIGDFVSFIVKAKRR
jgi:hypothetical protein